MTDSAPDSGSVDCDPSLIGIVRDFDSTHPDFQTEGLDQGVNATNLTLGLTQPTLVDGAPVLAVPTPLSPRGDVSITSPESFAEWYSTAHPEDRTFLFDLDSGLLNRSEQNGRVVYESNAFFPIDDVPNAELLDGQRGVQHNFLFTFELNTLFAYKPGDVFEFSGDDDLWVFINNQLVVDVGGVHAAMDGSIELDTLGLTPGEAYPLSVFHAERHTVESNFKITTNLQFVNCEPIIRVR